MRKKKSKSKAKLESIKKKVDVNNLIEYGVGAKVKYRGKWYPDINTLFKKYPNLDIWNNPPDIKYVPLKRTPLLYKKKKTVDVKGPAVWGPVVAKRGDRLKIYAYPKSNVKSDSIVMLGKVNPDDIRKPEVTKQMRNSKRSKAQKERWAKYKCYRQAFVNMGCKPMTPEEIKKSRATRPIDLHLSRKDASNLKDMIDEWLIAFYKWKGTSLDQKNMNKSANRILNKLKREGVK